MKARALLCLLLLSALARPVSAQATAAVRLQRMVSSVHIHSLREAGAGSSPAAALTIDVRALAAGREMMLRRQLRLPITDRADVTLAGRVGRFGPSSQLRIRLRF